MATVYAQNSPTIGDDVVFSIETPDASGCFSADPYQINSIKIYYVERNYNNEGISSTDITTTNLELEAKLAIAKQNACASPTTQNLAEVEKIQNRITLSQVTSKIYFNEAKTVFITGTDTDPAWPASSQADTLLTSISLDQFDNIQYGHFEFTWSPVGMREGDYFICWTWTPVNGSDTLSAYNYFYLFGNTQITTSIPTHFTKADKYETLQEKYLPEMFKTRISESDLAPQVLQELNKSVAKGFTFLEDMVNQSVDLIDSNATHESFLQVLGGTFGLKLRSHDPTLWRRQIKQAVPIFKKKGTLQGLNDALSQANIKLNKLTKLWQITSKYTWQEEFEYLDTSSFILSKTIILPIDSNNFELYWRGINDSDWTTMTQGDIAITNNGDISTMTWIGATLEIGDTIRILYQHQIVPNSPQQVLEDYVRTLSLMDQRDERDQLYPSKNWNVRLLEEDDSLFDILIPNKHPFTDSIVFGKVRTEFPYSENVYNMEEYNGSKRDSTDPCDIDKDFIDTCSGGLSSKYNVDIEIENISNERIVEAQEILTEFTPFHAVLHSISLGGSMIDIIPPPVETINIIATHQYNEFAVIDPPQMIFNRNMEETALLMRDELANSQVMDSATGLAKNQKIVLFCPEAWFENIGLDTNNSNMTYLEIMAPSGNAGTYTVSSPSKHHVDVVASEPLDQTSFGFRLSNELIKKITSTTITQSDSFYLSDTLDNYSQYGVTTNWTVKIVRYGIAPPVNLTYNILQILPDGKLILQDNGSLPLSNNNDVEYNLIDDSANVIKTSTKGALTVKRQGIIDFSGGNVLIKGNSVPAANLADIRATVKRGDYVLYNGNQYKVVGFIDGEQLKLYIENYVSGDVVGVTTTVYRRLIDNAVGYFHYNGMILDTVTDYESTLQIMNGVNASIDPNDILDNDKFKENFLILINSKYYVMSEIDGTTIYINGPMVDWETTGTSVDFDIIKYTKPAVSIPEREYPPTIGYDFPFIDRRGNEVIETTIETTIPFMMQSQARESKPIIDSDSPFVMNLVAAMSEPKVPLMAAILNDKDTDSGIIDIVGQNEMITILIEHRSRGKAQIKLKENDDHR